MKHLVQLQKLIMSAATHGHMQIAKEMADVFQLMCTVVSKNELNVAEEQYIKCILPNDLINILERYQTNTKLIQQQELHNFLLIVQNKKTYIQQSFTSKLPSENKDKVSTVL